MKRTSSSWSWAGKRKRRGVHWGRYRVTLSDWISGTNHCKKRARSCNLNARGNSQRHINSARISLANKRWSSKTKWWLIVCRCSVMRLKKRRGWLNINSSWWRRKGRTKNDCTRMRLGRKETGSKGRLRDLRRGCPKWSRGLSKREPCTKGGLNRFNKNWGSSSKKINSY